MIRASVAKHRPDRGDILDVLSKVGGLDIAGLAGVFLGGALCRTPVLIDGLFLLLQRCAQPGCARLPQTV